MSASTNLLTQLHDLYPHIRFTPGEVFCWLPNEHTISYPPGNTAQPQYFAMLLHEVGHALASHQQYNSGLDLLRKECEAWNIAADVASKLKLVLNQLYVDDCLDTYRTWLKNALRCPSCKLVGYEESKDNFYCLNCLKSWQITSSLNLGHHIRPQALELVA